MPSVEFLCPFDGGGVFFAQLSPHLDRPELGQLTSRRLIFTRHLGELDREERS